MCVQKGYTLMTIPHVLSFQVFDDPHQLIPSYHEYSITDSPTHSYSPTSGDSAGMPEYFISSGASTTMRSGGLGYGSHATEQGNTVFCEPQQRLQEPKVISNESNRVGSRNFIHILYKFKQVLEVEQNVRVSSLDYVRRKNVLLSGSQCSSELMKCMCAAILMLSRKVLLTFHV
ncbi:hypothetical protein WUBG_17492 [Wuchereria bancrofti]|uniref:Uncharacterized protein n=1 Tax=Wuchereria bancrofti TaxID=6293 RepID=J9DPZ0_WUCBA|nr:hypothetical protein WUBG_17492 [Wuchereria bancrofti]